MTFIRRTFIPPGLTAAGLLVCGLAACVPFGGWLYDDPTFVVSEMTIRGSGNPADTLEMVLTACNRNDFPIQADGFEVSLQMNGDTMGSVRMAQPVMLQTRDSTKLTVPVVLAAHSVRRAGRSSFVLTGQTMLQTPIGARRVALFQRGQVVLKPRNEVAYIPGAGRPCRPGRSTLPGYMPAVTVSAPPPIPNPVPAQQPQR